MWLVVIPIDFPWRLSPWWSNMSPYSPDIFLHVMVAIHLLCCSPNNKKHCICYRICHSWKSWTFETENSMFVFSPETNWNVDSSEQRTHLHCLLNYLRGALVWRTSCTRLMYSFHHKEQRLKIACHGAAADCVQWQRFFWSCPEPVALFNSTTWQSFQSVSSESSNVMHVLLRISDL